jgi:hypothetical protein
MVKIVIKNEKKINFVSNDENFIFINKFDLNKVNSKLNFSYR